MADKKKLPQIVLPKAPFAYPKLTEPDYGNEKYPKKDGEYSVSIVLSRKSPEFKQLMRDLDPHLKEAEASAVALFKALPVGARKALEKKNIKGPVMNPVFKAQYDKDTEEELDEVHIKAAMNASGEYKQGKKAGQRWERTPDLYDAKGKKLGKVASIWGGTVGRIAVELQPYFVEGTGAAGLKLRLAGVQILDLVSGGGRTAASLGFVAEDGYTAGEDSFPADDGMASPDDEAAPGEGDF